MHRCYVSAGDSKQSQGAAHRQRSCDGAQQDNRSAVGQTLAGRLSQTAGCWKIQLLDRLPTGWQSAFKWLALGMCHVCRLEPGVFSTTASTSHGLGLCYVEFPAQQMGQVRSPTANLPLVQRLQACHRCSSCMPDSSSPLQVGQVSTPTASVAQALAKTTEAQKLEDCAGMLVEEQTQASGSGQRMPLTIIFVERKARCDDVAELLRSEGLQALALHGGLSQGDREHALREFTAGNAQVGLCMVGRPFLDSCHPACLPHLGDVRDAYMSEGRDSVHLCQAEALSWLSLTCLICRSSWPQMWPAGGWT